MRELEYSTSGQPGRRIVELPEPTAHMEVCLTVTPTDVGECLPSLNAGTHCERAGSMVTEIAFSRISRRARPMVIGSLICGSESHPKPLITASSKTEPKKVR